MYQLLSLFTGFLLAIMISINGNLSLQYGVFWSAVIIHIVGVIAAFLFRLLKKEKRPLFSHGPKWIYLGGAVGVLTTLFNNLSFKYISLTSIVALGLFGQMATSAFIDALGLWGMKKYPFQKSALFGYAFALAGIFFMLDNSVSTSVYAVLLSIAAGVSVVLSRTVNACLSQKTGSLNGSLINHLVGLPITIIMAVLITSGSAFTPAFSISRLWIYGGGIFGVLVVLLFNVIVPQIPAFKLTVLTFIGQIFTGILLDLVFGKGYSNASFTGGIIIAAGIAVNLITEFLAARR